MSDQIKWVSAMILDVFPVENGSNRIWKTLIFVDGDVKFDSSSYSAKPCEPGTLVWFCEERRMLGGTCVYLMSASEVVALRRSGRYEEMTRLVRDLRDEIQNSLGVKS